MPDRIIRTIRGPVGGLSVILGLYLIGLGASWIILPSTSREAGVQWINHNTAIPITGLTAAHVAWWWVAGGLVALFGGMFSRCRWAERAAVAAAIFTPITVAALFIGAWVDGSASTGAISAWSYLLPAAIMLWQVSHERRRADPGALVTAPTPAPAHGQND